MDIYFIQSKKDQLDKFELLRDIIKLKKATNEVVAIVTEMLDSINDRQEIDLLSHKYNVHFSSSAISWQMEYDIASKILAKEVNSEKLTYVYELINYCFYFLLLPQSFRSTFFLLHGMTVSRDIPEWNNLTDKVRNKRYVIYKGGQELLSSYIYSEEILNEEDYTLIKRLSTFYNIQASENNIVDSGSIFVTQTSSRKK